MKPRKIVSYLTILSFALQVSAMPALAEDHNTTAPMQNPPTMQSPPPTSIPTMPSGIPNTQNTQPSSMPTGSIPDMSKIPTGMPSTPPTGMPTNGDMSKIPTGMPSTPPAGMPTNGDMSKIPTGMPKEFDSAKFPDMPKRPEFGQAPTFMGKTISDSSNPMVGQIGAAFGMIQEQLNKSESGIKEMKDGQINVKEMEGSVKQARELYEKAQTAFKDGDNTNAGKYLAEIKNLNMETKFGEFEKKAVSKDLINDVRTRLMQAQKDLSQAGDNSDTDTAKVQVLTSLGELDKADKLMASGKTKEAADILKQLRANSPEGDASNASGKFKGLDGPKIQTILDTINMGLTRASEGTAKLAENGIEVSAEDKAALEKAQALYQEAKNLFDEEKFSEVPTKLTAIKALNLEEHFSAYKEKAFPKNRLADIQTQMHNGVKALELTIIHSKEYGMDVTPMEEILTKLKSLVEKADAALIANSTEAFLTYADQAGKLRTGEKVDASIRKVADGRADSMIKDGLDKFNSIVPEFQKIISDLEAKKVNVNRAKAILNDLIKSIASAQNDYDKKEFMIAGRNINDASSNVISLKNILTDSGQKLSSDTQNGINAIITDSKDGADLSNINPDSAKKAQSMLSAISSDNAYKVKSGLMNFDPELLNRVIASREKDKKLIDSVMNDVMPLLSADEQAKFMDGKIGLIEESQSADNTIAQVKKIKGMAGDAIKTFEDIKNQIKAYNFDSSVATTLEEKIANFNDQIQSGELKDPTEIKNYISILKDSVKKAIDTSVNEKFKDGVIPAKNIDDTNPSFGNIEYLVKDGALSPDKNGNIDLKAKVDGKKIADMVNKTVDRKNAVSSNDKQIDMKDAIMITISAYFPNIPTNPKDFKDAESYAKKMGLNIQAADLSKPADMGAIAQIISKADQRWGDEKLK